MAVLPILEYPDPRLRIPARPVETFDAALARLVDDLAATLRVSGGIGLAAPQTGHGVQVVIVDVPDTGPLPTVFINPQVLVSAVPGLVEESCLSVPGVVGNVVRATRLRVRASDRDGNAFECDLEGMPAVCLLHEMDHLAGKLFIDRLPLLKRLALRARAMMGAGAA